MKKTMAEAAARAWGVPGDVLADLPRLSVVGRSEIYIENYKSILGYTDKEIRLSTSSGLLRIYGSGLTVDRIRLCDIHISGCFERVEYEL